jgi:hypothetical protein
MIEIMVLVKKFELHVDFFYFKLSLQAVNRYLKNQYEI